MESLKMIAARAKLQPPTHNGTSGLDKLVSEASDNDFSAWKSYNISRYDHFAKQVLRNDYKEQLNQFEHMKGWQPSLQRAFHVRRVPEPTARQVLHDTEGDVCWRCSQIDFKGMVEIKGQWYEIPYDLGNSTQVVRDPNCTICGLFERIPEEYSKGGRKVDTTFYLVAFPTSALYASAWTWKALPEGVKQTMSFSIFDDISFRDRSKVRQPHLVREIGCISPVLKDGNISSFGARRLGRKLDFAVIKAWLNYCSHNHLSSCTSAESPLHPSTKVIDCRSENIVYLGVEDTYLALSYVWGKPEDSVAAKTTDQGPSGSCLDLPETIGDAITLTKELGYSYLWVDRFCIPQDDTPERQIQIAQMDRIYAGAEATIIDAAGDGPHYGLPGISRLRSSDAKKYATINGQVHTVIPPDPSHAIRSSKWNSRAWTYQESQLSKRRIIFCDRQVYFECPAMHCYEAMQAPLHLLHSPLCSRFSEWNEPGLFPTEQQRHALDHLFHHLALYTTRDLSNAADILNGMLGIFNAFTKQPIAARSNRGNRRIMQIAGIPIVPNDTLITYHPIDPPVYHLSRDGQFITGLGWKLFAPAHRRPNFPSWSWTGWFGAVLPRGNYEGYIRNTHNLELEFTAPSDQDNLLSALDLKTILNAYQMKHFAPDYIPTLTVTGEITAIRVAYPYGLRDVHSTPSGLAAFMDTENGFTAADHFFITTNDPRLSSGTVAAHGEECIGLVLGMAQCTYFAGSDRRTRILDDSNFPLMILVLWQRERRWERVGLVEHRITIRTNSNPIPVGSGYLELKTERRRLRLG